MCTYRKSLQFPEISCKKSDRKMIVKITGATILERGLNTCCWQL